MNFELMGICHAEASLGRGEITPLQNLVQTLREGKYSPELQNRQLLNTGPSRMETP
jgi:hypothetical protein